MMKSGWFKHTLFACSLLLLPAVLMSAWAASLTDVQVKNSAQQATVTLSFAEKPTYTFSTTQQPARVVLDIRQSGALGGLPLNFSGQNLVKRIHAAKVGDDKTLQLLFDLTSPSRVRAVTHQKEKGYLVVLTVVSDKSADPEPVRKKTVERVVNSASGSGEGNPFRPDNAVTKATPVAASTSGSRSQGGGGRVVVAIDAGHGGPDPGAIGPNGLKEKKVTLAIAQKLRALLQNDSMFEPVLTRNGDYFISVMGRSDIARQQGANVLVSLHADAAPNRSAKGASVWVLSNRRANNEMANWLEQHEKQSELLGGAGDVLANSADDPYLSQAVLDLQFGHSQRVGYDVATKVLSELQSVGNIHKRRPEHASLGVLRSPDIPSLLVETGFISNSSEERLLGSSAYQEKIAQAIHRGLRSYFLAHPLQADPKVENRPLGATATVSKGLAQKSRNTSVAQKKSPSAVSGRYHTVKAGEGLTQLAKRYGTSVAALRQYNKLPKDTLYVGQRLAIPPQKTISPQKNGAVTASTAARKTVTAKVSSQPAPLKHKVKAGETLTSIAVRYGVSHKEIQRINKMSTTAVQRDQILVIPRAQ